MCRAVEEQDVEVPGVCLVPSMYGPAPSPGALGKMTVQKMVVVMARRR